MGSERATHSNTRVIMLHYVNWNIRGTEFFITSHRLRHCLRNTVLCLSCRECSFRYFSVRKTSQKTVNSIHRRKGK